MRADSDSDRTSGYLPAIDSSIRSEIQRSVGTFICLNDPLNGQ